MEIWSAAEINRLLKNSSRIGLFDSGVGGLSVLRELQDFASATGQDIEFVYVADTARCPYGNRDTNQIRQYAAEIVTWLNRQALDLVIVACNTSASLALSLAKQVSDVPVLDLISPTAEYVVAAAKIGVMATASTVRSQAFSRAIKAVNATAEVIEIGCPDLVPIVESGDIERPETLQVLQKYTSFMMEAKVESIILGCTHFPFLKKQIQKQVHEGIKIIDPAESLTLACGGILSRFASDSKENSVSNISLRNDVSLQTTFYVTGSLSQFNMAATKCLGRSLENCRALSITELEENRSVYQVHQVGHSDISSTAILSSIPVSST